MTLITVTKNNTDSIESSGWIGLELVSGKTWRWKGGLISDYRNWAVKEPVLDNCVAYNNIRQAFITKECTSKHGFVCQDDNLVVVKENKTWEEALNHCRRINNRCKDPWYECSYKYNLLSLKDSDYQYVRDRIYRSTTDEVRNFFLIFCVAIATTY